MEKEIVENLLREVWGGELEHEGIRMDIGWDEYGYRLTLTSGTHVTNHVLQAHVLEMSSGSVARVMNEFIQQAIEGHKESMKLVDIPLFTECVIGYRQWKLDDWVLAPTNYGPPWRPGVNKAVCRPGEGSGGFYGRYGGMGILQPHEAPDLNCHCGFNVLYDPPDLWDKQNVIGAVVGWGNLRVHPDGFRAEYAQIVGLLDADGLDLTDVAHLYQVPIATSVEGLQVAASSHGSPLPDDLKPKAPEVPDTPGYLATYTQALKSQWISSLTNQFGNTFSSNYASGGYSTPPSPKEPKKTQAELVTERAKRREKMLKFAQLQNERSAQKRYARKQFRKGSLPF